MNDIDSDIDIDVAADLRWLSLGIGKVGSIRQLLDIDIDMLRVIHRDDISIEWYYNCRYHSYISMIMLHCSMKRIIHSQPSH